MYFGPIAHAVVDSSIAAEAHITMQARYDARNPAALKQLVGAGSGLIAYLILGQHLDRKGGFGATPLGMLMVGLVPILYVVAPSLPLRWSRCSFRC